MFNIRVICPSSSFKKSDKKVIDKIVLKLNKKGYNVTFGKNIFESNKYYKCASIKDRLSDLEEALNDKNINIIMCGKGGFNSNQLLPYLKLKKYNKKFIGMSDNTILVNVLSEYLDTYLGPNFINLKDDKVFNNFIKYIEKDEYEIKLKDNNIINNGVVEGNIVAFNLCTINLLQGTKYLNKKDNVILFIEDDDNYKEGAFFREFDRNLESLLQTNLFDIKGIVFGKFENSSKMNKLKIIEMINNKNLNIPVFYNLDFGHKSNLLAIKINSNCVIKNNIIKIKK